MQSVYLVMTMVLAYRPRVNPTLGDDGLQRCDGSPRVTAKGAQDGDPEGGQKLSETHHAASTLAHSESYSNQCKSQGRTL